MVDGIAPQAAHSFLLLQLVFPLPRGLQREQNSYLPGALDTQMQKGKSVRLAFWLLCCRYGCTSNGGCGL